MRILHIAPFNFSGVPIAFVRAERDIGHYSRLITLGMDKREYEEDICLKLPWIDNILIRRIKNMVADRDRLEAGTTIKITDKIPRIWEPKGIAERTLFKLRDRLWGWRLREFFKEFDLFDFDVYQLDGGLGFVRSSAFMKKLKQAGKKIICCYLGNELRVHGVIPEIDKISDLNVTLEFDHLKLHPDIHHIFYPFDAGRYKMRDTENEIIKICHAPTFRKMKGSNVIIKAVRELETEYPCKLVLIEGVPYKRFIQIIYECDIVIDQLGELGYGINSLEALAMGIPVCTALTDEFEEYLGEHPFFKIDERNIKERLIQLITNRDLRMRLKTKGRKWVEERHDPKKSAQKIHSLLQYDN